MNKTGSAWPVDSSLFWTVFIVVLSFLFLAFVIIVTNYGIDEYDLPKDLEVDVIEQRFFTATCFGVDSISRNKEQKKFDWDKFTQEQMNHCYSIGEKSEFLAYTLHLKVGEEEKEIKTPNWDDEDGIERVIRRSHSVFKDGDFVDGELILEVQNVPK